MNRIVPCFLILFALSITAATAHPVAQGSMEITKASDQVRIVATVSTEEAFVAEALAYKESATSLEVVWQRHGTYLLEHLEVEAGGQRLVGKVEKVTPIPATDHLRYDLRFAMPPSIATPNSITLRQHVLNEFNFAPGNRWEATYIVNASQVASTGEGLLFTSREPLIVTFKSDGSASDTKSSDHNIFADFLQHGIRHILSGYDHLLFVAGLVLAVVTLWDLVKVVTAFTLAHTITLTLAVLDIFRLSSRIVEPMIAASIIFVAVQNIVSPGQARGRWRLAVAFGFGLFHGLGFAGGLLSAMEGMQTTVVATAIVAFSLGVELGHQIVALPLFAAMKLTRRFAGSIPGSATPQFWVSRIASGAIGIAGTVYLVAALHWIR